MKSQKFINIRMLSSYFMFFFLLFLLACGKKEKVAAPYELRIDYKINPLGVDNINPQLGWILGDTSVGAVQTAYQILVATTPEALNEKEADVWNSGKVDSDESTGVGYDGASLKSATRYYWAVRTWDKDGNESELSQPAWFETAFLSESDWKSKWIGLEANQKPPRSLALRKEINLDKNVKSARLYSTGLGGYVVFINGNKVGKDLLTPGWTHYPKKVQYQIYDVTENLESGANAIGAYLGNQWWSGGLGWKGGQVYSDGPLRLMVQLNVEYEDGTAESFTTDESWKVTESPIVENTLYHGELFDARLEQEGWNKPGFDDSNWESVVLIDMPDSINLVAQQAPPIQVTEEITPVDIKEVKPGVFVFDMGQNMVGSMRLKVNGKEGDQVMMRFSELVHPDGTVAQENLRSAKATDTYILKGNGPEEYVPYFTYHGYRYVQVEGLPSRPDNSTLTGLVFHTNAKWRGSFASSNDLLNSIQKNINWGTRGNIMEVPTDCPQRDERLGWMGDAQIFAATANYNADLAGFWRKWQKDILDCQEPEGWVYDVNPAIVVGGPSKPGWGDAVVIVPWESYLFYGDKKILEDSYDGMKAWVKYMENQSKDYVYEWGQEEWGGYGDWVPVEKSPTKPIGGVYFYFSSKIMSQVAEILGKSEDAEYFKKLADNIAVAYHNKYFVPEEGEYLGKTQTANLLPLAVGIVPENMRKDIAEKIAKNVMDRDNHLTTGFLGTKYLLPILSDYGYHDLAYKVAVQRTYPSWGYMVDNGATTMWELWNSDKEKPEGMNSRNHFAYGSVGEWYYSHLAGIKPTAEHPGFKKSIIAPKPVGDLTWVNAEVNTLYGKLRCNWEKTAGGLEVNIKVPANTTAEICLPKGQNKINSIKEKDQVIYENGQFNSKLFAFVKETDNEVIFEVPAGVWNFSVN